MLGLKLNHVSKRGHSSFNQTLIHQVLIYYSTLNSDKIPTSKGRDSNLLLNSNACWAPFYYHGLTLIPAWISKYTHCKGWDKITYMFLKFNGTVTPLKFMNW